MRSTLTAITFTSICLGWGAVGQSAEHDLDLKSAWFTPILTINADPICESILPDIRRHFKSTESWHFGTRGTGEYFTGLKRYTGADSDPTIEFYDDDSRFYDFIGPGGARLYAYFHRNPGCGGACETENVLVSDRPIDDDDLPAEPDSRESPIRSTPVASEWAIYTAKSGDHYVMGVVEGHMDVYRIAAPHTWTQSCGIALVPERLRENTDTAIQAAAKSVDALNVAIGGLMRDEGACGTSHTLSRWAQFVTAGLEQTLYRPWALRSTEGEPSWYSENSYGDYSRIFEQLKLWSLGGLSERQAFAAYEEQLARTKKELAGFYSMKYGWSPAASESVARDGLEFVIAHGFGFYMYTPFPQPGEAELRQAILERRPMQEIRNIKLDKQAMAAALDIAIQYPEALRYLLDQGANPNTVNGFGKTPLMYAAQYNQMEAAKLLLARGADPNAATTWPNDTCFYILGTSRMTALHYAVRYASAGFIRWLLGHGASTFNKTETGTGLRELPLDWLKRYGDPAEPGRNPNLRKAEIPKLVKLLQVPESRKLAATAINLTKSAKADYAAGKVESAYQKLVAALNARPHYEPALMDLSLVALRSGRPGESIEAALVVLAEVKDPESLASAWFNIGLACEKAGLFFSHNGRVYCATDPMHPFLQAWKLGHSKARKEKLRNLMASGQPHTCTFHRGSAMEQHYRFEIVDLTYHADSTAQKHEDARQLQRIYVFHASSQTIEAESIKWSTQVFDSTGRQSKLESIVPGVVERYNLDEFSITELMANFLVQGPVAIGDQTCNPYE